jgi:hypothetical protein
MIKGGHKPGKTATHTIGTTTSTWYTEVSEKVVAKELFDKDSLNHEEDLVTVPCKAGSILIFPGTTPHRSLNSFADEVRWSCDFRLHPKTTKRPGKSELDWFYGLKDSLLVRDGSNKNYEPDWDSWANIDRTKLQESGKVGQKEEAKLNLDPVVVGPWMDLWDIEEHVSGKANRHLDAYLATPEKTRDVNNYIKAGNW